MNSKARVSFIVIFTMMLFFTTMTARGDEESQTIYIEFFDDDGFITETGAHFPGQTLVTILDPNMDIYSYLVFRQIEINSFESLTNATLRLRTASSLSFDADSKITIWGVKDGEFPGFSSPSAVPSYPLTFAHVNYNTSEFYGSSWKEIDVSNIVEELKSSPTWEGDEAIPGTFGFIIFGNEGHDTRYFYDLGSGNGLEAQLVIWWGEVPEADPGETPPDYNGSEFVWEYVNTTKAYDPGDNETDPWEGEVDIFKVTELGPPEMIVSSSQNFYFYNTSWGNGTSRDWADAGFPLQSAGVSEMFVTQGDWTYFIGRNTSHDSTRIYWSDDQFQTWNMSVRINAHWPFLTGQVSDKGVIWADQNESDTIYFAWMSETDADPSDYQILFSNFTRNPVTGNLTFSPDYFNVTEGMGDDQSNPDMYVQRNGTIHIVWEGKNGTTNEVMQYRRRQANGTWLPQVRVSSDDVYDSHEGDVVANEETGVALIVWTRVDVGDWDVFWDVVFPNNTAGTLVGTQDRGKGNRDYVSVVNDRATNVAHMIYFAHSVNEVFYRYKLIDNSTAWSGDQRLDIGGDRKAYGVIALDESNSTLVAVWWDMDDLANEWNYWNVGTAPTPGDNLLIADGMGYCQYPHSEDYVSLSHVNVTWWLLWPNGTVIGGPYDTEDDALTDLDDLLGINPLDPDPLSQEWDQTGPFTRFKTRLYIWMMGFMMMVGPVMFFAYRRPSGYNFVVGLFIMLIGLGFLIAAGSV